MKISTPHAGWSWVRLERHDDQRLVTSAHALMRDLAEMPGVKFFEPENGAPASIELPQNTWCLPEARELARLAGRTFDADRFAPAIPSLELYAHQQRTVERVVHEGHGVIAHPMGLGKTSCALVSALTLREDGPTVIVAPRFTRETWKRELARLGLQDEGFFAATGVKADVAVPRDTRWIFIHYEVLDAWGHVLRWVRPRARVTIYDEAHWLKNATSKRGKAAHAVRTPHAICLTGTPLANRPSELWSLLALASGPSAWGSFFDFRQRYCGAYRDNYGWRDGQPTFVKELRDRLSRVYTRYELDEVGIELPPLRRQKIEVPADASDDELLGGVRLERVYESLLSGSFRDDTLKTLTRLRKASSRAKVPATADAVSSMLEQGESVLLFCWERAMVDALGKAIRRRVAGADVHTHWGGLGSMGDLAVARWQDARTTGAPSVLISTLDALKEGVTLTRARHVVLHDLSWVPTDVLQAEARVHRIGQHVPCTSTWVALEGGIDPIILRAFAQKAHAQKETLGFGATRAALQELGVTPADDDGFAWLAEHAAELAKKLEASS